MKTFAISLVLLGAMAVVVPAVRGATGPVRLASDSPAAQVSVLLVDDDDDDDIDIRGRVYIDREPRYYEPYYYQPAPSQGYYVQPETRYYTYEPERRYIFRFDYRSDKDWRGWDGRHYRFDDDDDFEIEYDNGKIEIDD